MIIELQEKFLIFLDILGFNIRAKIIEEKLGVRKEKVRYDFIKVIDSKLNEIKNNFKIEGICKGHDDWILVISPISAEYPLDICFQIIFNIFNHNSGYGDEFKNIPLEIGIGTGCYDQWANFDGEKLITEQATIDFLKRHYLEHYHNYYKNQYSESIKSNFIILTKSAYRRLNSRDKEYFKLVAQKSLNIEYFVANLEEIRLLYKCNNFLNLIGIKESVLYSRIFRTYIKPLEYDDIIIKLRENRLIFITGTPEYGKTYSAVFLLWKYFMMGYNPKWFHGDEPLLRQSGREFLEQIENLMQSKQIIYFEDPFGKLEYEPRENLERNFATILDIHSNLDDIFIIITSREEIFKIFKSKVIRKEILEKLESRLFIKNESYNIIDRRNILETWAYEKDCKWFFEEKLKSFCIWKIYDKNNLPTPLSIENFVLATKKKNTKKELEIIIEEKSIESYIAFSNEIIRMSDEYKLFLLLVYLEPPLIYVQLEKYFNQLVGELNLKPHQDFQEIYQWFIEDKVIKTIYTTLEFSHPIYIKALEIALFTNIKSNNYFKKLLKPLLIFLSKNTHTVASVANIICPKYQIFENEIKNILFEIAENTLLNGKLALPLTRYFNVLPEDVRNLLIIISKTSDIPFEVATGVCSLFNRIPDDYKYQIIKNLIGKDQTIYFLPYAISKDFSTLSEENRQLLFEIIEKADELEYPGIAHDIFINLHLLPRDLRIQILENVPSSVKEKIIELNRQKDTRDELRFVL